MSLTQRDKQDLINLLGNVSTNGMTVKDTIALINRINELSAVLQEPEESPQPESDEAIKETKKKK